MERTLLQNLCLLLLLLQSATGISDLPATCAVKNENLLDCYNLHVFPSGRFPDIEAMNFSENNFTVLETNMFRNRNFNNLKVAILRYSNINTIEEGAFASMSSLLHLNLCGNNLKKLTNREFAGLVSLVTLNLSNNRLTSISPDMLAPLTLLNVLDLSTNSIKQLPVDLLLNRPVRELDISENPVVFSKGPVLISPSLSSFAMAACGLQKLPFNAFKELPNLKDLNLSKNKLRAIPKQLLESVTALVTLDVSENMISQLDNIHISSMRNLEELHCDGNPLPKDQTCKVLLISTLNPSKHLTPKTVREKYSTEDTSVNAVQNLQENQSTKSLYLPEMAHNGTVMYVYMFSVILIVCLGSVLLLVIIIRQLCYFYIWSNHYEDNHYETAGLNNMMQE